MRRKVHRSAPAPEKPELRGELYIHGSVPCAICGRPLTQADVEAGAIVGAGSDLTDMTLWCIAHFYIKQPDGSIVRVPEPEYQLNMDFLAQKIAAKEG